MDAAREASRIRKGVCRRNQLRNLPKHFSELCLADVSSVRHESRRGRRAQCGQGPPAREPIQAEPGCVHEAASSINSDVDRAPIPGRSSTSTGPGGFIARCQKSALHDWWEGLPRTSVGQETGGEGAAASGARPRWSECSGWPHYALLARGQWVPSSSPCCIRAPATVTLTAARVRSSRTRGTATYRPRACALGVSSGTRGCRHMCQASGRQGVEVMAGHAFVLERRAWEVFPLGYASLTLAD